jgi:ZIP family zinc transporter
MDNGINYCSNFNLKKGIKPYMFTNVLLTGVGVGMSTFIGSLLSFPIKKITHKMNDIILSFAAGIMLAATVFSLIIPSMEQPNSTLFATIAGIAAGAFFITILDKAVPHIHNYIEPSLADTGNRESLDKVILFLLAIAIHNFPEGLAVGVSFTGDNIGNALSIAIGISLQNIPEGMITIIPLIAAGLDRKRAMIIALITGLTEVLGTLIGYAAISVSAVILPFILAFAGGTMLFVISHEMIPDTHSHGYENQATYSLIAGFIVMLCIDYLFA